MTAEDLPTAEQIIEIHDTIEEEYDLTHTGTAVAAPRAKLRRLLEDVDDHDDLYTRAAALLYKLITAHYFEDGNKRTAWATIILFLEDRDAEPAEGGERAERVLKRVRRYEVEEIADWLADGTLDRDRLEP